MPNGDGEPTGRVTTAQFYEALLKQNEARSEMERRLQVQISKGQEQLRREIKEGFQELTASMKEFNGLIESRLSAVNLRIENLDENIGDCNQDTAELKKDIKSNKEDIIKIEGHHEETQAALVSLSRSDKMWGGISTTVSSIVATIVSIILDPK